MLHRAASAVVLVATLLVATVASADSHPTARLAYERAPAAVQCPSDKELRDAVGARLGYDALVDGADRTVALLIEARESGLVARLELKDAAGSIIGQRELASSAKDCIELASSVALAISIAVDPLSLTRSPPVASPPPGPAAASSPAPDLAPASLAHGGGRLPVLEVGVGSSFAFGAAPSAALGVSLRVGLRWPSFSASLEGRRDLPASTAAPDAGRVRSSLSLVSLVGCLHGDPVFACGLFGVGAVQGEGYDVARPESETTPQVVGGGRAGAELRLGRAYALRLQGDLLAGFVRTTLSVGGRPVWTSPPISGVLGLAVVGTFL